MEFSGIDFSKNCFTYAEQSIPENTAFSKKLVSFFASKKQPASQKVFLKNIFHI